MNKEGLKLSSNKIKKKNSFKISKMSEQTPQQSRHICKLVYGKMLNVMCDY